MFLFYMFIPLVAVDCISLWNKNYLTYSLEGNNNETLAKIVEDAIREWDIKTLEIERCDDGRGDIRFHFRDLPDTLGGQAQLPEGGDIDINRNVSEVNLTQIVQHEFAHALGLSHSENVRSVMFPIHTNNQSIRRSDRNRLNALYACRYDSVTLLNGCTYLKFKGRHYERIDLDTEYTTGDHLWPGSGDIRKVSAMYRNDTYFVIAENNRYYEYDYFMRFLKEGLVAELFHNLTDRISAVLTLRKGDIIAFLDSGYVWRNGDVYRNPFEVFPSGTIQGAFSDYNGTLYVVQKDHVYTYDEDYKFIGIRRICDGSIMGRIHCCNDYSRY